VTVLSWNINGEKPANARRRMIESAITYIDPDVMLLQETKNSIINPKVDSHRLRSLDKYISVQAGKMEQAQVFYKKNGKFEEVSSSTVNLKLHNILKEMFSKNETLQLGRRSVRVRKLIRNRACVVCLRHKLTKREIIFISYHNIAKGGGKGGVETKAAQFCQIIAKLHASTKCCVIAGVDFNCSDFDSKGVKVQDYEVTLRRKEPKKKKKVDYFILSDNAPVDGVVVEAFDLFPQNNEAPFYGKLQSLLRHNTTEDQYKKANDHDPLKLSMQIS
ncbi:unnamed protein product, partial [Porites evermanni]